jgi:alkylation response protein AidB-like acyl-CoA dehydrogenase
LAAAESDELVLDGIEVSAEQIICFDKAEQAPTPVEVGGLCWFNLLVSASYLGIASGLVERVLHAGRGSEYERASCAGELEASMSALEGLAARIGSEPPSQGLLAHAQLVRYAVQDAIQRASSQAVELLGGLTFILSPDVAYLLAAGGALAFHPPSRSSSMPQLAAWLTEAPVQGASADVAA